MSGAASKAHSYDYLPLCDALQLPVGATQCHLYGVVVECSYPRPTKGTGALPLLCTRHPAWVRALTLPNTRLRGEPEGGGSQPGARTGCGAAAVWKRA